MIQNSPFRCLIASLIVATTPSLFAQTAPTAPAAPATPEKRTMTPSDYKGWEQLGQKGISHDGHWFWANLGVTDSDSYVLIKNCDDARQWRIPSAGAPTFSDNSQWFGCLERPPMDVIKQLSAERKPIEAKLQLKCLVNPLERTVDGVDRFHFLKGSPWVLVKRTGENGDLLLVNLAGGSDLNFANVKESAFNERENMLALNIVGAKGEEGVQLVDLLTGTIRPVLWGKDHVRKLAFAEKSDFVTFLLGHPDDKKEGDFNALGLISGNRSTPKLSIWDPSTSTAFPKDSRISENGPLAVSSDGKTVIAGIAKWADKKPPEKPGEVSHPEVWNTVDLRPIPVQRVRLGADKLRTDLYAIHPTDGSMIQLASGNFEQAFPLKGFGKAVKLDSRPYESATSNGFDYSDIYIIDLITGQRTKVLEKTHWGPVPSPEGKYLAYYQGRDWRLYDVVTGKKLPGTADIKTTFEDTEDDHLVPEKPPADQPHWLAGDAGFVISTQYDSYLIRTGGTGYTQLTNGAKDHLRFRFTDIEQDDENPPKITDNLWFNVRDEDTENTGFYQVKADGKGGAMRFFDAALVTDLQKVKDGDRVIFTMQTFTKSPNAYVTNQAFSAIKPVTKTNPQLSQFKWGKSELVTYKSRFGVPLKGVLIYPADYKAGQSYPMITYIYERLSDSLNRFVGTNESNSYNAQILSQNGYFVFMPDIAYQQKRRPGQDAVDCLEPAVAAVLAKKVGVDAKRVGLMGHSWGAYQTAFVTTVSKVFAAGVAGAPLTEMTSMYNSYYWNSGTPDAVIFETSQGRMGVPFWEDPETYIKNSPVWRSRERQAPILIEVGDADGAVDYHQGLYLYNTLRRLGKPAVMVLYHGENHGLAQKPNQLDYAKRLRHWFDVYLKGAKPESWVTEGEPLAG